MMSQPVIRNKRVYNRYVSNQTLEDYSLRYTARSARDQSAAEVANAALGSISFLALEVIGANIAIYYGINHLFWALVIAVPLIYLISSPIVRTAVKHNIDIDLLTRGAGFGYLGSSITSLVYASFTFIFLAFEATIIANLLRMAFSLPLYIGYFVSAFGVIPLILKGFKFIGKLQRITQPLWGILQLAGIAGTVLLVKDEGVSYKVFSGSDNFNILFLGSSITILLALVTQVGEQVDYLRFMPDITHNNAKKIKIWSSLSGPGWILFCSIKIFLGGIVGVFLMEHYNVYTLSVDPNYIYYRAFKEIFGGSEKCLLFITGVFIIVSQFKINMTNGYAGSLAWSNFFSRMTHTHPGRIIWVFFNVVIAYILMNYNIYSISSNVLSLYSVIAVAWCGTLLGNLSILKKLNLIPDTIEFKRAYLYDINPVGLGSFIFSATIGYICYTGLCGDFAQAFCSLFTLLFTIILPPLLAFLTHGKYYLSRPKDNLHGKIKCSVCGNTFDAEDMCFCPRYEKNICSLCCTLDSSCMDSCKNKACFIDQVRSLIPAPLRKYVKDRVLRFIGHLIIYTLINLIVLTLTYVSIRLNYSDDEKGILLFSFSICFWLLELVLSFHSLLITLSEESRLRSRKELFKQNELLEKEIAIRKQTEAMLQEAKSNAEAANIAKTRYLSGISHELRTPLNTITGYGQILSKATDIPEKHRKAVTIMSRSGDYLANLIEGLLDISKIEAGRLDLHYERTNLKILLEDLTTCFEDMAKKNGLEFIYEHSGYIPEFVKADEKRLRQLLTNLLSNAVKYTRKGYVRFSIKYRSEVAEFTITDTGIGIKNEDIKKIFAPFNRLDEAKKKASGTGLGLTITNLLVTVMGGELDVSSEYGKGTTFKLRIALSSMQTPDSITKEKIVTGYKNSDLKKYRILCVDDNEQHRELVRAILEPVGFEVFGAEDPDEALKIVEKDTFDLYMLDISMPGHDGWYCLEKLRELGIRAPIVMVSAEASEGNVPDNVKKLHNGYIIKPYRHSKIFDSISTLLPIDYIYEDEIQNKEDLTTLNFKDKTVSTLKNSTISEQIRSKIVLERTEYKQYMRNLDIAYVKGMKKLNITLESKHSISGSEKRFLDYHLDNFDFDAIKKVLAVKETTNASTDG